MHAAAAAEIIEYGPDPHRPAPRFVLLLDTSGSMADPLGPRDRTPRLDALRQALADLFDLPVDVDHGAVLYDGALRRVIPPARGAERAIEAALAAIEPGERTNFARPLEEAIFLLPDAHDVPSFALLLSDGLHNEGGDPAPVASRLRAGGVTLFTLFIGDPEARDPLSLRGRANLHRLAGPARGAPSPDHAYTVGDARSLGAALRDVTERIACGLGPLEPPPAAHLPLEAVRVWLRDPSGDETPLTFSFDVARDPAALTYTFVREGNRVELSRRACAEIIDRGATPIARYGDPVLVE
ncbi:MAG: VWA domain-containing protein [Myxococcales bacterium]|nr:VWA domain-containing protein [Myxococcales bacterium]